MNVRVLTTGAATMLLGATLSAQTPSLAGTWVIDRERTLAAMAAITPAARAAVPAPVLPLRAPCLRTG